MLFHTTYEYDLDHTTHFDMNVTHTALTRPPNSKAPIVVSRLSPRAFAAAVGDSMAGLGPDGPDTPGEGGVDMLQKG